MTPIDMELALVDSAEYLYLREPSEPRRVVIPTMRYSVASCFVSTPNHIFLTILRGTPVDTPRQSCTSNGHV
jgi:hypothetical protein